MMKIRKPDQLASLAKLVPGIRLDGLTVNCNLVSGQCTDGNDNDAHSLSQMLAKGLKSGQGWITSVTLPLLRNQVLVDLGADQPQTVMWLRRCSDR